MIRIGIGLICVALYPVAVAYAAPAELLNKSVRVSFTTTIPAKGPDGTIAPRVRNNAFVIYIISSAGRAFSRISRTDGNQSQTKEAAPGQNSYRFGGNKLVGVQTYASGAAQITVTFNSGGQSCNATFISGRDSGRVFRFKGVNGATYEATGPASWSNVSCSITGGNAFAQ